MTILINLIYFIIILGVIVLVHEFGHFLFAKMFGVYVYEFSIGMGPKLFSKKGKNKETDYSLRAIPIGGYVSLAGEEVDDDKKIPKNRKLYSKPIWQRLLIMFFGAGFNFIFAILILCMTAAIWGAPSTEPVIKSVMKDYPAEKSGLVSGDVVLKVNSEKISTSDDLSLYLQIANKDKEITLKVQHKDGEIENIKIKPEVEEVDGAKVYKIGVKIGGETKRGFVETIKYTFVKTGALFKQMFVTFKSLFTGVLGVDNLSGPIGIYNIVGNQREAGFQNVLLLIALLSINVGFINLIPFPAFDGGRILFLIIEKIKGSPVKPEFENTIHTIGFFLLIALMLYVTFNDILRLF